MKPTIMALWSEMFGLVYDVQLFEEHAVALIGKIPVVFPIEVEQKLRHLIGNKVAIIRTDIAGKEYIIRTLSGEKPDHETESAVSTVQAAAAMEKNALQRKARRVP